MKKKLLTILKSTFAAMLLLSAGQAYGQIVFTSTPDSIAVVNELYSYDVEVVATPNSPTFSLLTAPAGMTINASTGLINWTPASLTVGGLVVVKAQNNWGSINQSFYVYITDAIVCDPAVISYWPMDAKSGTSIEDFAGGYTALWEGAPGPQPVITRTPRLAAPSNLTLLFMRTGVITSGTKTSTSSRIPSSSPFPSGLRPTGSCFSQLLS